MGKRRKHPRVRLARLPTLEERLMAIRTYTHQAVGRATRQERNCKRLMEQMGIMLAQLAITRHSLWTLQRNVEKLLDDIAVEDEHLARLAKRAIN